MFLFFLKKNCRVWRNNSAVKHTCKWSVFNFQHPLGHTQLSIIPVPEDPMSTDFCGHCIHMMQTHMCRQTTHTHQIKINIPLKKEVKQYYPQVSLLSLTKMMPSQSMSLKTWLCSSVWANRTLLRSV